ncbi:MAG: hypothetical protein J5962_05740 [Lachnospiraceae bacterium]|nr:hypothetical protein [Lachnospiraceae bacterium]
MVEFKKFSAGEVGREFNGSACLFDPYEEKRSSFFRKKDMQGSKCKFDKKGYENVVILENIKF